ncbi:hypothetical protein [Pseudoflavonifractor phocaeensis]|uniref:hypothetical protein n=1 Tax=Pseudoflavonifractor phocaeensis TaxID=1870988 RepID=UPI00195DD213|nr:hypothetical protein [Pseudoflavonifractor phocaeensis]MBM6924906.1 hypothetical protein [Pseudoflavonifractor phocaeensis]
MTNYDTAPDPGMEELISRCFWREELLRRELRLTEGQAAYIAGHYAARVIPLGEQWYEITFQEAF